MAAVKGSRPPNAGKGRKSGVPNKVTGALKDMILQSLSNVGGVGYLEACATDDKTKCAYLSLIGRVLPLQIKDGGADPKVPAPIIHEHVIESQKTGL